MERLWIAGGRVVDPASGRDEVADVLVEGGRIVAVARGMRPGGASVLDARSLVVAPGLVDLHVHLRDPGQTHKEDIASGTRAAARGGVTSVVCMANTKPPVDDPVVVEYIRSRAREAGAVRVYPVGAVTKGLEGKELSPIGALATAGVVGLSDDGRPISDAGLLRRAMLYSRMFDLPILEHCEDPSLSAGGVMHEGEVSVRLGLRGIPRSAEEVVVARDLVLAEETGAHVHIQHVSTRGSVRLIREAKTRGVRVTAEVTPHHLALTDESLEGYDPNFKMNPPLRSAEDVEALLEGLRDGTLDCIATDHAPHAPAEKLVEFDAAPFGVIGLETLLGVVLTRLVWQEGWPLGRALSLVTDRPARILGLPGGRLQAGAPADLVLLDPGREWVVDPDRFHSKSRNTPFGGWTLRGRVLATLVEGRVVWMEEEEKARLLPVGSGAE
ncbi:MAG: dihydroorotase [Armatimonadetes bacterium]|nr:dihydroorotase [Armatimonadota bacterium]MDW8154567.1 dihydroorotase [Armatimonadota bacterium]